MLLRSLTFDSLGLTSHHNGGLKVSDDGWTVVPGGRCLSIISPVGDDSLNFTIQADGARVYSNILHIYLYVMCCACARSISCHIAYTVLFV